MQTQFALVPGAGTNTLVTVDGVLPHVSETWETRAMQDRLETLVGTRPRFLRVAAQTDEFRLRVFEDVDVQGTRTQDLDPKALVPEPLQPALERFLAEQAGTAPIPAQRPAWARPGWHEQAEAWAGMPLEQVRSWPLSYVGRNGDVWFKAVFPLFHAEPAVTQVIGKPRVLRVDRERGWMLMEHVDGEAASDHHGALRELGRIHSEWSGRVDELLALGVQDRRRPTTLPYTMLHGDFHPWNVLGSTILDWSDAAVGNPMYDVVHYLFNADDESLLDTYAEAAGADYDVRAAVREYEAETYEDVALSYTRITDALAPDDKWWFADEERLWLGWASDVRAGRRPNRGT